FYILIIHKDYYSVNDLDKSVNYPPDEILNPIIGRRMSNTLNSQETSNFFLPIL
ncbi:unnamed protein product, partial [marine sediment metagenome]